MKIHRPNNFSWQCLQKAAKILNRTPLRHPYHALTIPSRIIAIKLFVSDTRTYHATVSDKRNYIPDLISRKIMANLLLFLLPCCWRGAVLFFPHVGWIRRPTFLAGEPPMALIVFSVSVRGQGTNEFHAFLLSLIME